MKCSVSKLQPRNFHYQPKLPPKKQTIENLRVTGDGSDGRVPSTDMVDIV